MVKGLQAGLMALALVYAGLAGADEDEAACQAASLAAKSNAWAGKNRGLQAANWRIISQARSQRGDFSGAQQALDMATRLEIRLEIRPDIRPDIR